jgi:hypothetical protein
VVADTFAVPRLNVTFLCRLQRGAPLGAVETSRQRWHPPDDLPPGVDPDAARLVRLGLGSGRGGAGASKPGALRSSASA